MRPIRTTLVLAFACSFTIHDSVAQSPGGYGTNLRAWYKANASTYTSTGPLVSCTNGQTVTQWNDQTANVLHLSQATAVQKPTWRDGVSSTYFNYNPSIQFGDNYLQRAAPGILTSGATYDKLNLYAVYYDYDAANFDWLLFTSGANGFTRVSLSMNWAAGTNFDCDVPSTSNRVSLNTTASLPINRTNIVAVKSDITGIYGGGEVNKVQAFANGTAGASSVLHTSIVEGNFPTEVGDNELVATDATNQPFTGELAELFLYTGSVSQTNHQRIESYLALKYSAMLFTHDYFSSAGTNIYVNSGSYVNSIMGIGRDDNSGLMQKQSRQADDSTRIYLSALAATNVANGGAFSSDGQFVLMGNDGGKMKSIAATAAEKPSGLGIFSRLNREWKVTNTAFNGIFSLNFKLNTTPITASDLRLLVDDDGNFTNASLYGTAAGLTFSYAAGVVTISGITTALIPINTTKYITIASMSSNTPLPVEMTFFNAQPDHREVELTWATATEHNNDHFDVERSRGGSLFTKIGEVDGNGTSQSAHNYGFLDVDPFAGTNYYRVKQIDMDGAYEYSDVRSVTMSTYGGPITVVPNPAQDLVRIAGLDPTSTASVEIFDATGQQKLFPAEALHDGVMNVSTLPKGLYIARIGDQVARIIKE